MGLTGLAKADDGTDEAVMGDEGTSRVSCGCDSTGSTTVAKEAAGAGIIKGPGTEYDDLCRFRTARQWSGSSFAEVHGSVTQADRLKVLTRIETEISEPSNL